MEKYFRIAISICWRFLALLLLIMRNKMISVNFLSLHHLPRLQAQILKLTWEMTGVYKTGLTALTMTVQAMEMDNKNKSIMN